MTRAHRLAAGVAAATAIAAMATGCGTTAAVPSQKPGAARQVANVGPAASPAAFGASDTAFGLGVLGAWCRSAPDANIVMSPVSLATGLGMAYLGARGSTARAMAGTLHLPAVGDAQMLAGLQARARALRALDGPGVTVAESDRLWADLATSSGYRSELASAYGAGLTHEPLLTDPSLAARQIDAAIARQTQGHIGHLLSAGQLGNIGWLLTDALYLKAKWATPFQQSATQPASFSTASGRPVQAQYLNGGKFASVTEGGWTGVALPYQGGQLEMLALLPPPPARAASTGIVDGTQPVGCPSPSAATVAAIAAGLRTARATAEISLPKVNLSSSSQMNSLLSGLGMGLAFSPGANFTGISPQALDIGLVVHAATMRVDEAGTVASAATAVGVTPMALRVILPGITFNRPYLMIVLDKSTGEPLFLARVANPDQP
jgi:serpin B